MTSANSVIEANTQSGSNLNLLALTVLLSVTLLLATPRAFAGDQPSSPGRMGTVDCAAAANMPAPAAFTVAPSLVVSGAEFTSAGVALRNRGAGAIQITGINPPISSAWLYWAVITNGAPTAAVSSLRIKRINPLPASMNIKVFGTQIGSGAPCWTPGTQVTVFRGQIPLAVATGNGLYQVTLLPGAGGRMDGADPFDPPILAPLWEGASIVMIGAGTGRVSIFDQGLAGNTFVPSVPFNYTLALPFPGAGYTYFDNIGADGQHVTSRSRTADWRESDETTAINGFPVAGFGSDYLDSDWNGSSGLPVPELWDDTGHDITRPAAGSFALDVTIFNSGGVASDCLTTVANVVRE